MRNPNFFRQAPPQDTDQKRFLDAVLNRRNLIASFPLDYPTVSLYSLTGLISQGLSVVVCHDASKIRRNLEAFRLAGLGFPDVAVLDGTQMPHEERMLHREINHNRVRILYITPERFISLTFLEILVHHPINFVAIEEAERLLPDMPGHVLYTKLYEQGLQQLGSLPPIVLMIPTLPPEQVKRLSSRLNFRDYQFIQCSPSIDSVEIQVKRLLSEHQKFQDLTAFLSGSTTPGSPGRLDEPGSVLIQTAFPAQAEKLAASLLDYGFDAVRATHFKKAAWEQAEVFEWAATQPNAIVVNGGVELRAWRPAEGAAPKLVFWTPPPSLEGLFMQIFRQPAEKRPPNIRPVQCRIYHTREDFTAAVKRANPQYAQGDESEKLRALGHYRKWIMDETCRIQSAASFLKGGPALNISPCGRCDRCLETGRFSRKLRKALENWLY